jgi:aspartyl-tRNA(Asn)/glutamyl-tRNA(Gln) amidotransferase subunit A
MTRASVSEIHARLAKKEISARELAESYLKTIEEKDPEIHAFLDVYRERAMRDATRVDEQLARGEKIGLLAGVPIVVKDNILIEGERATAGSKILGDYIAAYDAHVISKLKKEGGVFLGKTNLDEFAMGGSTENSAYGPTKNPRDTSRVPGGSSGGSAAAVAAGMAPVALGSDTGGSIRQPAAFCGVVGFKPSYGRVSRSGLISMASSLDQIGTFANSVEDAEILFRSIEGRDALDSTTADIPVLRTSAELSRMPEVEGKHKKEIIVGIPKEFFASGLDKDVEKVIRNSLTKFENTSVHLLDVSLPNVSYALACYYVIMPAEVSSNLARFDGVRYGTREEGKTLFDVYKKTRARGFGAEVKRRIAIGTYVLSHGYYDAYYLQAQKVRTLIARDFATAFEKVDVIAAPTTPSTAFRFGEKTQDPLTMYLEDVYTVPVNLAGLPAISIPVGDVSGLPVGLQLIGKRFCDYALLDAAKRFEAALA